LDEKRFWEVKARVEKVKHKFIYPLYCCRPVYKNNQGVMDGTIPTNDDAAERKEKQPTTEEDEWCCDAVPQLLLEGKKGKD